MLKIASVIMSYTHTLSIQGVQAILQMNVDNSVVKYTLTLRADSGEEVVTNGRLPNDAMDNFIVINQHFKNPELIAMPSKGLGDSLSPELKQTMEQGIQTSLGEIIEKNTYPPVIPENRLQHSHSSITMLFDIPCDTESIAESVDESFSPILPSSPKHVENINIAQSFEQELQDLSNKAIVKELEIVEPVQQEEVQQEPVKEEPVKQVDPYASVIEQLGNLRQYTNPTIKQGIIEAVHQHLVENKIIVSQHPILQYYMYVLFTELLVVHLNDNVLRDLCITMLYLAGKTKEEVQQYLKDVTSQYQLLCKVGKYYKLNTSEETLLSYWKWKEMYKGPSLNRWDSMKAYLYQRK